MKESKAEKTARLYARMESRCGNEAGATMARAIVRQFGADWQSTLRDVCRGGADAGFSGFCYYSDTASFFKRHRRAICGLVDMMAGELGDEPMAMVAGFNCLRGDIDSETRASIGRCLYGGRIGEDDTTVANALAWFALEETARTANPEL